MGFITKTLENRTAVKDPALRDLWGIGSVSKSGVSVSPSSAMTCVPYFAGVRLIAETAGQLPLIEYQRLNPRGKRRATDRRLYYLLHDEPNPEMSAVSFKEALQGQCVTWGNAFAEIDWDMETGAPRSIWPLQSSRMKVGREPTTKELLYVYTLPDGKVVNLPAYRVWHMPGYGYDGLIGYDTIHLFREAIGLALGLEEFGARFFGNGTNTGGFLQHPNKLSKEAFDRLKNSMAEQYEGLSNAHRLMILEDGMTYSKIGIPPDNAQFLESRKFQKNEIATILHIPPHMIGDLEHATFCLPADVEVYSEAGPKSIAAVQVGERVWSLSEAGAWELANVKVSACTGEDEILTIRTTNRTIRANAKHRILARRKHLASVTEGRKIGGVYSDGKLNRITWENEWVEAGGLQVGDTIITLDRLPDTGSDYSPTRKVDAPFMEFLGLYLGDGNKTHNSVSIARAGNAGYMDYYRQVMSTYFTRNKGGNGRGNIQPEQVSVTLDEGERYTRFSSVSASAELDALGFAGTAHTKSVPDWVFGLQDNLKLAFLSGYLDADGDVDKKGRISYSSCNEKLLSRVRHLCMGLGIAVTNLRCQEGETTLPNGKKYPVHQYTFTCSNPEDNCRIGSHDPIYIKRLSEGKPFNRKDRNYPRYGGKNFDLAGCSLARITEIKHSGPEPVYDLEVEGSHSFVANGVIVHNSNIEHLAIEFVTYTMTPWLTRWEETCNRKLLLPSERYTYFTEFMVNALLRGDSAARAAYYRERFYLGSLSPNDIRELENENPIPDPNADKYYVQANMLPMEQAGKAQLAPPAAGRGVDDAVKRIAERDKANIARAWKKDPEHFETWLNDYFRDFPDFIKKELKPLTGGEPEE